jgi:exodeoxyribonuclease VII small subunit
MAKKKSSSDEIDGSDIQNQSLEESMAELAAIVSRLESGQETLDESLAQFERGMKLLRTCHSKLDVAAQRIEIVTQMSPDGEVKTADFDAAATLQKPAPTSRSSRKLLADEDADDALLF